MAEWNLASENQESQINQTNLEKKTQVSVEDWHIKSLVESISKTLEENHNNWNISDEEYEIQKKQILDLYKKQNLERSELIKKYKELESLVLWKSNQERKDWWEDSFIINWLKWSLYKIISVDEDLEKNDTMQNFIKWVIDELISLPELVEVLIRDSNARKQFIEWIKNLTLDQVKETFFEWVWNIASWDAYETWKSAVFTILLLTWLWWVIKSWWSVAGKVGKKMMVKSWEKSLEKWLTKTAQVATKEVVQWTWKTVLSGVDEVVIWSQKTIWKSVDNLFEKTWRTASNPLDELYSWASKTAASKTATGMWKLWSFSPILYATTNWVSQKIIYDDYYVNKTRIESNNNNQWKYSNGFDINRELHIVQTVEQDDSTLDILDWKYDTRWNPKLDILVNSFKEIPLDKMFEAYDKATIYDNPEDVFETYWEITDKIAEEYIRNNIKKTKWIWKWWNNEPKYLKEDIMKLRQYRKWVIKNLMFTTGYFLRKEKWVWTNDIEKKINDWNRIKIWDLLKNERFKEFIKKEKSFLKKDVWFYEFKSKQLIWLQKKLWETSDASFMSPGLQYESDFWDEKVKKSIEFKTWNQVIENKRWLYIGWQRFLIEWITEVTKVWIFEDKFVINWKMYGETKEIKLDKNIFRNGLNDLIFSSYHRFQSIDWKTNFAIKRAV